MSNQLFKVAYIPMALKERQWFEKHDKITFGKILVFEEMLKESGRILIGRPETIIYKNFGKCVSVRLDKKNRYVFSYKFEPDGTIVVVSCKGHYDDH
ncbi:MAG: type II toxin-antitoxin system YoeB family toxin [Mycoplasmataceae bacterium]|jgi:hypothetical protein|nr:type II toxin-antitoxin system YoeB family toxin [Mycoplasmataceae bacterium]